MIISKPDNTQKFLSLACLCSWAGWFKYNLVGNPEDRFSHGKAHMSPSPLVENLILGNSKIWQNFFDGVMETSKSF